METCSLVACSNFACAHRLGDLAVGSGLGSLSYALVMLSGISFRNFKCFSSHIIPLRPTTIIVGKNNAGKSTIIEALRLVALIANRLEFELFTDVPRWLDIPRVNLGIAASLSHQDLDFKNAFHSCGEPPAEITAKFESDQRPCMRRNWLDIILL
jgi:hypothetical protein